MLLHAAPAFARHINLMIANDRAIYVLKLSKGSGGVCEKSGWHSMSSRAPLKMSFYECILSGRCLHFPSVVYLHLRCCL